MRQRRAAFRNVKKESRIQIRASAVGASTRYLRASTRYLRGASRSEGGDGPDGRAPAERRQGAGERLLRVPEEARGLKEKSRTKLVTKKSTFILSYN